jgi:hypothetical protein
MMTSRASTTTERTVSLVVAVGLAVDAFVHVHLAHDFSHVRTSTLSQADLFYVEAVLAVVAAVAILVRRNKASVAFALLVAAGGFVAVVLYRYVDVGGFGPIPDMYDPYWAPAEKAISAIAELVAAVLALMLFLRPDGHGSAVSNSVEHNTSRV